MMSLPPPGDPTQALPFAHGGPVLEGRLRSAPEDFLVDEDLGYAASGSGEHVLLTLRKRGRNTQEVARALARFAGVPLVAVGYAGLKDRHALTVQHFTVQLPGRDAPDWSSLKDDTLEVLGWERHHRKIRRGALRGNRFVLRVTEIEGDRTQAERCLLQIRTQGVPNYFGGQRFGRDGQNLARAAELFAGRGRRPNREQRGLLLSAARGYLFNQVLLCRVADRSWDRALDGEVLSLAGSNRQFRQDPDDHTLASRLAQLDVHPTGPLCGRPGHALRPTSEAAQTEQRALSDWTDWIDALARLGVDEDRRALRLAVEDLTWQWEPHSLVLRFGLTAGTYATAVVRELVRGCR